MKYIGGGAEYLCKIYKEGVEYLCDPKHLEGRGQR